MASANGPQLSADSGGTPATLGGGISRLSPSDGLFLRAQHLSAMEDYALELARSIAVAAGTGVVYGYRVWIDGAATLKVDAGLAIGPDGRPLRSSQVAELDLSDRAIGEDRFFVVEVTPASWDYGQENVYGNLCDDPCSNGTAIHPYRAEGIEVSLRPDVMPGLSAQPDSRKRNWLASAYYERERERGEPWLVPGMPGVPITGIAADDFTTATPAPDGTAVPLAALLKLGDNWLVDLWIARRDMGDPAPRRAWQARLAMRPWDIFIAQVLQFQAQLTDLYLASLAGPAKTAATEALTQTIDSIRDQFDQMRIKPRWLGAGIAALEEVVPRLEEAVPGVAELASSGLLHLGFAELPPAGYLPRPSKEAITEYAARLFGPGVDVRICRCRADHAVRAVERAQHLDRIPLDPRAERARPSVDLLVPDQLADLAPLYVRSYPWLAFARRTEQVCGTGRTVDEVAVYVVEAADRSAERIADDIVTDGYPPDSGRLTLAAVRTALLTLEAGIQGTVSREDIRVAYQDGLSPEAIVLVVGPPQDDNPG